MFNKALLMAVGGEKKVVPTNGVFYSQFSIKVGYYDSPSTLLGYVKGGFDGVLYDETGEYRLISGNDMFFNDKFMFGVVWGLVTQLTSPHLFDEDFSSESHIFGLVNETTNDIYYGVNANGYWGIISRNYDDVKNYLKGEFMPDFEAMPLIFSPDDADKTFTFSFYICD